MTEGQALDHAFQTADKTQQDRVIYSCKHAVCHVHEVVYHSFAIWICLGVFVLYQDLEEIDEDLIGVAWDPDRLSCSCKFKLDLLKTSSRIAASAFHDNWSGWTDELLAIIGDVGQVDCLLN